MTITIVELKPPQSASMKVSAAGIGAQIEVASALEVAATDSGSTSRAGRSQRTTPRQLSQSARWRSTFAASTAESEPSR